MAYLKSNRFNPILDEVDDIGETRDDFLPNEEFKELMGTALQHNQVKAGNVVSASVIRVDGDVVVLDLGGKSEPIVPIRNFTHPEELQVGSQVNVYVRNSDSYGDVIVSTHEVKNKEAWERIYNAEKNRETIKVVMEEQREAGSNGKVEGTNIAAFLPRSHSAKHFESLQECLILSVDRRNNSVVVSRKLVLEAVYKEARDRYINSLEEGQVISGVVRSITSYGAFICIHDGDFNVDAFLYKKEIPGGAHPSAVLTVGQTVKVKIVKVDRKEMRVSVTMKLDTNLPENIEEEFPVDSKHKAIVSSVDKGGLWVRLNKNNQVVECFVPRNETTWTESNIPLYKIFRPEQEVQVTIIEIEKSKNKITGSLKRSGSNPWAAFYNRYSPGSVVKCYIKAITNFRLIVGFCDLLSDPNLKDIEGVVHPYDLSWHTKPENAIKSYRVDSRASACEEPIMAKVLRINVNKGKIILGIKQLDYDPFQDYLNKVKKGTTIDGRVSRIEENGVFLEVNENVVIFISEGDLPDISKLSVGQHIIAEVIEVKDYDLRISVKSLVEEANE